MSQYETSINMRLSILRRLNDLSKKTSLCKKEIILFTLRNFRNKIDIPARFTRNTEYQKDENDWKKFRICFSEYEREISYDLRKLYKLSFSYIVALSIMLYGNLLFSKDSKTQKINFENFMYKYTDNTYLFSINVQNDRKILTFIWESEVKLE